MMRLLKTSDSPIILASLAIWIGLGWPCHDTMALAQGILLESPAVARQSDVSNPSVPPNGDSPHQEAFPDFEPEWNEPTGAASPPPASSGAVTQKSEIQSTGFDDAPIFESPLEDEPQPAQPPIPTPTATPEEEPFPGMQPHDPTFMPAPEEEPFPGLQPHDPIPSKTPSDEPFPAMQPNAPFTPNQPHLQLEPSDNHPTPLPDASFETIPLGQSTLETQSPYASLMDPQPTPAGPPPSFPPEIEYPQVDPIPASERDNAGEYTAWWDHMIPETLRDTAQPAQISIGDLVYSALQHSSRVKVISESPLIRDTAVIEADADFDWGVFLETAWNDVNDPVGSTLTTGGPPRYQNEKLTYDYGVQKRNRVGGELSIGQQYGWEQSNSIFFIPNNQGTGRLTLNYTQPLMRGSGFLYNTSTVVLAQINTGAARDEFSQELQTYLQEVTEAYWTLYLERGSLLQRQRLYKRGEAIMRRLEVRQGLDTIANQVVRAKSAVASRKSDLYRAAASVKNAEGQIRALVNSPHLGVLDEFELLPMDPPAIQEVNVTMHDAIEAAVRNRPELHQSMKEIHAASVRLNVSQNELLPVLDLVINSYVSGLRGDASIGRAFTDQFNTGSPSYSTGLRFEYPFGNRAARARNQRRGLELRQLQHQFRNTLHLLQLEVETAMRETMTTYREVAAKHQAMRAAEGEVELLADRWEMLPGDDRSASLLLEDLLSAQDRLARQEYDFLQAQVNYSISLVNLKRSTGTLLQFENISVHKTEWDGVPQLHLDRVAPVSYQAPIQR